MADYKWAAAFAAYCQSTPLSEISQTLGIPMALLKERCKGEVWSRVRKSMVENTQALARLDEVQPDNSLTEKKLAALQRNRERNLIAVNKLMEHAVEAIEKLRDGTLELEKVFNGKAGIVRATVKPSTGDWVNIATYLRTLQDLSYRALGDTTASEKGNQDVPVGTPGPAITIILPAAIAAPRQERQAKVIDLQDVPLPKRDAEEPND